MQQRYYDPLLGVFLSVDPVTAYDNGDMRYFNRYAYAFNNPYSFTDPDGRCNQIINGLVGGLPCELQQRNLNPAHVAADEATARDARMLVGYQAGEVLGTLSGMSAMKFVKYARSIPAERVRSFQFGCMIGLSGACNNTVADQIRDPSRPVRQVADDIVNHVQQTAEVARRSAVGQRPVAAGSKGSQKVQGASGSSDSRVGGFQGVFRVQGRIDSMRLERELSGKK